MLSKEATFATSSTEGKGIRMIIDYLREEKQDAVRAILDEKPAFTTGMEKFEMDVHDQQLDFLSDDLGIKMNDSEDAVERYAVRIQTAGQQPGCHELMLPLVVCAAIREGGAGMPGLGDADGEGGEGQGLRPLRDSPLPQLLSRWRRARTRVPAVSPMSSTPELYAT